MYPDKSPQSSSTSYPFATRVGSGSGSGSGAGLVALFPALLMLLLSACASDPVDWRPVTSLRYEVEGGEAGDSEEAEEAQVVVPVQPLERSETKPLSPGIRVKVYPGAFEKLPDFSELKPVRTTIVPVIDKRPAQNEHDFGLLFTGFLQISEAGEYDFLLKSDDGSALYLGDKHLIDNDGKHGAREVRARAALEAGAYPIRVEYFQGRGGAELSLSYGRVGVRPQEPRLRVLAHERETLSECASSVASTDAEKKPAAP